MEIDKTMTIKLTQYEVEDIILNYLKEKEGISFNKKEVDFLIQTYDPILFRGCKITYEMD